MIRRPILKKRLALSAPEAERRIHATTPGLNSWMAANAGSGKTTVLRNRVIRLLLAGARPDQLLCLTFTKAAAAEMQDRIFKELAAWVTLPELELDKAIALLTGIPPTKVEKSRARRLFAAAVETPGGLKIQTIHAFAERILHLFPIEAGVPVDFIVLDEAQAEELKTQARKSVLHAAITQDDTALARAFDRLIAATGQEGFARATSEALSALARFRARHPGQAASQQMSAARYGLRFGIGPETLPEAVEAALLNERPDDATITQWAELIGAAATGIRSKDLAQQLRLVLATSPEAEPREEWLNIFLTKELEPRKTLLYGDITKKHPELIEPFEEEQARLLALLAKRRSAITLHRSRALLTFGEEMLDRYIAMKKARNALDFDDLITALRRMLLSGTSAWVMMKLDAAIDHILVDEAQDTTPAMWEIIRALADDFFAGEGQRKTIRTIFVVGDEKQSIYSFQGAKPDVFDATYQHFSTTIRQAGQAFERIPLTASFRSSDDLMQGVNAIFATPESRVGLSASGAWDAHQSAHVDFPGLIEIWPATMREEGTGPDDPDAPVDAPRKNSPAEALAERIAQRIRFWLDQGAQHFSHEGLIKPGDIVILVRHRNRVFEAILRALKRKKVPVAGADRLRPNEEIGVRDLLAIAEFCLLPSDDLSLAIILKSPFCGLSDDALEALARGRSGALFDALEKATGAQERAIFCWLTTLIHRAKTEPPFRFFALLLTLGCPSDAKMSGRKAMLTRLGHDCADAIDALLADALQFGQLHPPSLLLFVRMQRARETVLKRDLDQGGDQVRIMTVHGAKGLEGKIVFLADTWAIPNRGKENPVLLLDEESAPLLAWAGPKADEADAMAEARDIAHAEAMDEYRRLLYVAVTRAAERLYVTSFQNGKEKEAKPESWYASILAGLTDARRLPDEETLFANRVANSENATQGDRETQADRESMVWRYAHGPMPHFTYMREASSISAAPTPPDWLTKPAVSEAAPQPPLRPSRMADPDFAAGPVDPDRLFARQRGMITHHLLEFLPRIAKDRRADLAEGLVRQAGFGLDRAAIDAVIAPVLALLESPAGQDFFGPSSQAEVGVSGVVALASGALHPVNARIDRLVVTPDCVRILDFKTGTPPRGDQLPGASIMRQMALYRALMQSLYPDRDIECAILWTLEGRLQPLPAPALLATMAQITLS